MLFAAWFLLEEFVYGKGVCYQVIKINSIPKWSNFEQAWVAVEPVLAAWANINHSSVQVGRYSGQSFYRGTKAVVTKPWQPFIYPSPRSAPCRWSEDGH